MLESFGCGLYTSAAYTRVFTVFIFSFIHSFFIYISFLSPYLVESSSEELAARGNHFLFFLSLSWKLLIDMKKKPFSLLMHIVLHLNNNWTRIQHLSMNCSTNRVGERSWDLVRELKR